MNINDGRKERKVCETCSCDNGMHDGGCVRMQLHEQRVRIVKAMVAWRTQYDTPMTGPVDLNSLCREVVNSAIRMVQETR